MRKSLLLMLGVLSPFMVFSQQWETILPDSAAVIKGFINVDNTTELVGYAGNDGAYLKVFGDGQYEMTTFPAPEGKQLVLQNLIPLDDGGYFVSGMATSDLSNLYIGELRIMILDEDLNVLSEQTIEAEEGFLGLRGGSAVKDDDGSIVLLETACRVDPYYPSSYQFKGALFRFAQSGECLNCRYLLADPPDPICYMNAIHHQKLMNDPYSGQTVALSGGQGGVQSLLYFDYDFNLTSDHFIDDTCYSELGPGWQCKYPSNPYSDYWYNANEMMLLADQRDTDVNLNKPHLLVGKMNREGVIFDKIEINKPDTLFYSYGGMAYANDSTVYVGTRCHTESWLEPYYPHAYLVSTDLEILGKVELWEELNHYPLAIFPTNDGGCVLCIRGDRLSGAEPLVKVIRYSREDFHPVPVSVSEAPRADLEARAFPNPAGDVLRIDLSGLRDRTGCRVRIADAGGHLCADRVIPDGGNLLTVGVGGLKPGVYTYMIYDKEKTITSGRFVKE